MTIRARSARRMLARAAFAFVPAIALAACAGEEEDTAYEAGAEDLSGGELQVREPEEGEVPVDVPEVEMTSVPPEEAGEGEGEDAAAE